MVSRGHIKLLGLLALIFTCQLQLALGFSIRRVFKEEPSDDFIDGKLPPYNFGPLSISLMRTIGYRSPGKRYDPDMGPSVDRNTKEILSPAFNNILSDDNKGKSINYPEARFYSNQGDRKYWDALYEDYDALFNNFDRNGLEIDFNTGKRAPLRTRGVQFGSPILDGLDGADNSKSKQRFQPWGGR
ncbi:unnamed protein product [Owenia fusiformis]|uniref:Uncharacterized protein n=1 Tax=Owenia fusiformis TaxID=6347 RepID=A0A8J1XQZ4_OWEFU|nr:unnamed protein product [Owenia fusiformis]